MKRKKGPEKGPGNQEREKQADTFQVDFEFYDPEESDFHSVRELLCTGVLRSADLDFSGLADSIVEQVNIGTTVKSGGEEEGSEKSEDEGAGEDEDEDAALCGFLTCLNLHQFSEKDWRKGLVSLLETKAQSAGIGVSEKLKKFVSADTQPGLLVSERFVNLPLELVPMLHKAVLEDIRWSQSTEHCPSEARARVLQRRLFHILFSRSGPSTSSLISSSWQDVTLLKQVEDKKAVKPVKLVRAARQPCRWPYCCLCPARGPQFELCPSCPLVDMCRTKPSPGQLPLPSASRWERGKKPAETAGGAGAPRSPGPSPCNKNVAAPQEKVLFR